MFLAVIGGWWWWYVANAMTVVWGCLFICGAWGFWMRFLGMAATELIACIVGIYMCCRRSRIIDVVGSEVACEVLPK
jgi:hypothetical protein